MTYTLDSVSAEQDSLRLDNFNYDFAWALGQTIRDTAAAANLPIAIEIAHGTTPVFTALLPGATIDNFGWTARKRAVAHRFHRSSLAMRLEAEAHGFDFNARYLLPKTDYIAAGGGVPLILKGGTLIGTVGVSGLPGEEDHLLVIRALRALLSK